MDLKELESGVDPTTHWYYQSKKKPLLRFIQSLKQGSSVVNLIDIGAGSGFFSYEINDQFPKQFSNIYLVDTAYSAEEMRKGEYPHIQKQYELPPQIEHSLVLMMDVLEHLKDDASMLRNIKLNTVENSNNFFFITVPAFQSVWSAHDVYLEHYRRYTKSSLKNVLLNEGYKIDRIYYLYGSLFPFVFIKRKLLTLFTKENAAPQSDMKPLPSWLNALLLKYATIEMLFTKYNIFFGLTCVAEGRF